MKAEAIHSMVTPAIVWPGLEPETALSSRAWRRRLRRASRSRVAAQGELALVAAALGLDSVPPAGPLARLAEGIAADDRVWFRAEPVTLVADRDRLALLRLEDALGDAEAEALIAVAHEHFAAEGMHLERHAGGRWYFSHPAVGPVAAVAPEAAAADTFDSAAFHDRDARVLVRLLNELQMIWHAHPVNSARRSEGRAQANALWVWGGGRLSPRPPLARRPRIFGGNVETAGLTRWLALDRRHIDDMAAESRPGDSVMVIGAQDAGPGLRYLATLAQGQGAFFLWVRGTGLRIPARGVRWRPWRGARRLVR